MSDTPSTPSTPGSQAIANLKQQELAIAEFKKPTKHKKFKQKILTEEKYVEEISKIIQRDFFPDLEKLRAQNAYLDAMDRKDYAEMEAIRAKYYTNGRRPTGRERSMTPATFETPRTDAATAELPTFERESREPDISDTQSVTSDTSTTSTKEGRRKDLSESHSLDSFLQNYTSEDNFSFQEIIDAAEEKLRQKFAVLYKHEETCAEKLARALTLPSIEQQFDAPDPMRKIETWSYTNMNSIMYIPDGVALTEAERIEAVNRKQSISHNATRLSVNPFNETTSQKTATELAKHQSQTASDKIGVDGKLVGADAQSTTTAPQVRGFDLVKTPSPRPGEAFSPLMTWGEIEGTPFRLDGSDTPIRSNAGPSFKINESSRRETIALALAEKVGEKMRAQKQRAMDTARKNINSPYMRSNMDRLASMSPAARRLASSKLGLRTPLMTPSPLRKQTPTNARKTLTKKTTPAIVTPTAVATMSRSASTPKQTANSNRSTLTDDLLQIPAKRSKAADFF